MAPAAAGPSACGGVGRKHHRHTVRPFRCPVRDLRPSVLPDHARDDRAHERARRRTMAVRHRHRLPLPVRAPDHRARPARRRSCRRMWYRTGKESWLRLTHFFGKLLLINFALGVVTGIVQEFQFGMNWSGYSRFVGDVFGAPLAMEGLVAFFLESTFLGLWIFGWDRLSKRVHLRLHLGGRDRRQPLGVLHPGRQLLHAAPGRGDVQPRDAAAPSCTASGTLLTNVDGAGDLPARRRRRVPGGRWLRPRGLRVAPAPGVPGRARTQQDAAIAVFRPAVRLALVAIVLAGVAVVRQRPRAGPGHGASSSR